MVVGRLVARDAEDYRYRKPFRKSVFDISPQAPDATRSYYRRPSFSVSSWSQYLGIPLGGRKNEPSKATKIVFEPPIAPLHALQCEYVHTLHLYVSGANK